MLNDDCLGCTLDWLYAHDPTKLFAGIASRARQIFGVKVDQIHVDSTSFSVSGEYAVAAPRAVEPGAEPTIIAITYGYSRDHREDLKQWICALATTHDGDPSIYVADNGIYSESNMRQLNEAGVKWVSRVSETSIEAKAILNDGSETWQSSEDGTQQWFSRLMSLPQGAIPLK